MYTLGYIVQPKSLVKILALAAEQKAGSPK